MPRERWRAELDELRRDNRSGAAELELSAARILEEAIAESAPTDGSSYRRWLLDLCRQVLAAKPFVAGIFRMVNDLLWYVDTAREGTEIRTWALHYLDERRARVEAALSALCAHAVQILRPHQTIMTYSRSSTVLRALLNATEQGGGFRVICSEGRPALEGQLLAFELASAGIKVTMGVDMALFSFMSDSDVLIVGADGVSSSGIVNKIGTRALLNAALELEIPRIVMCTSAKFLPEPYVATQGLREGDPDEVMPGIENVTIRNPYFELVPLDLISFLVSEEGRLEPSAVLEHLREVRIYPRLLGREEG